MLSTQLRLLLLALRLYARWVIPGRAVARSDARSDARDGAGAQARIRALRYLPLAGAAIAIPASLAYIVGGLWLPHAIAVLLSVISALLLGAAVHERGLARCFDQIENGAKESIASGRTGAFATIALAMLMLGRVEILSSIDPSWIVVTLVCAATFSRACAVAIVASLPATSRPSPFDAIVALALGLVPLVVAIGWTGEPAIFLTAAALTLLAAAWLRAVLRRTAVAARDEGRDADAATNDATHRPAENAPEHARAALGLVQTIGEIAFMLAVLASLVVADPAIDDSAS